MSKLKDESEELGVGVEMLDELPKDLTEDQTMDLAYNTLVALCTELETKGLDREILTASLFILFSERMYEADAREEFEDMLEEALEDSWPEAPTLH